MYIFIDESGDLEPGKGTEYFIIGMVFYYKRDLSEINRVINMHNRFLWQNGWPKSREIKATHLYNYKHKKVLNKTDRSNLKISPRFYLQEIYNDINELDIKSGFLIHKPSNQGSMLRRLHKETIYNFLSKKLYNECFGYLRKNMNIYVDQRNITLVKKQKKINRTIQRLNLTYIGYINHELTYQFAFRKHISPKIEIYFENSKRMKGLQVADYLTWAVRKKYEGKPFWYNLLIKIEKFEKRDNF